MRFIITERQGGKTTELFEWLARGGVIETEYLGGQEYLWSRAIVTTTDSRKGSTKRYLQRWVRMQHAYRGAARQEVELLFNAVYTVEEVQEARGAIYRPMSAGLMEFAMDDVDTVLEMHLGTPLAVVTARGSLYEREDREIPPIGPSLIRTEESTRDEDIFANLSFRKGLPL